MRTFSDRDDDALLSEARRLSDAERAAAADFLACLAEVDRRELFRTKLGYASLFEYCVRELKYSEPAAYRRAQTVQASKRAPEVFSFLRSGELSIEAVGRVAKTIEREPEKACEVLEAIKGKAIREVERFVAEKNPEDGPRDRISPIGNGRYLFKFTAGPELVKLVERTRDLLRHKYAAGRFEEIFLEAISAVLSERDPALKKIRSKSELPVPGTGGLPDSVRAFIWRRDGERCVWKTADGRNCGSTAWLEIDHIVPRARGGTNDPDNLRLLCRAHNQYWARELGLVRPQGAA